MRTAVIALILGLTVGVSVVGAEPIVRRRNINLRLKPTKHSQINWVDTMDKQEADNRIQLIVEALRKYIK